MWLPGYLIRFGERPGPLVFATKSRRAWAQGRLAPGRTCRAFTNEPQPRGNLRLRRTLAIRSRFLAERLIIRVILFGPPRKFNEGFRKQWIFRSDKQQFDTFFEVGMAAASGSTTCQDVFPPRERETKWSMLPSFGASLRPVYWQMPSSRSQMPRAPKRGTAQWDFGVVGGDDDGRHAHGATRSVHGVVALADGQTAGSEK